MSVGFRRGSAADRSGAGHPRWRRAISARAVCARSRRRWVGENLARQRYRPVTRLALIGAVPGSGAPTSPPGTASGAFSARRQLVSDGRDVAAATASIWRRSPHRLPALDPSGCGDQKSSVKLRRGRDSNPRSPVRGTTVFETAPFDRSGTSPFERGEGLTTPPAPHQPDSGVCPAGAASCARRHFSPPIRWAIVPRTVGVGADELFDKLSVKEIPVVLVLRTAASCCRDDWCVHGSGRSDGAVSRDGE